MLRSLRRSSASRCSAPLAARRFGLYAACAPCVLRGLVPAKPGPPVLRSLRRSSASPPYIRSLRVASASTLASFGARREREALLGLASRDEIGDSCLVEPTGSGQR
ncbi:MAG: hypothetical protein AAF851_22050, partial [Myxococcota bacterium]